MSKHTPGPWTIEETTLGSFWVRQSGGPGAFSITLIGTDGSETHNRKANARLIAAAPDLLESLENLLDRRCEEHVRAAQNALAKAKG